MTPEWVKIAGVHPRVWWQVSQGAVVGTWLPGIDVAAWRLPGLWQEAQSRGVPRKMPPAWQVSQRARVCAPVRR